MNVDSREITERNLFVCKGAAFNPSFVSSARKNGASAYLCEEATAQTLSEMEPNMPCIVAHSVRHAMALLAPIIYNNPNEQLFIAGITGTKGKSTTAYMLRSIMQAAHKPCGIMGSIITDDGIECFESHNTTPEAPELWRHLYNTVDASLDTMIMEVSSQALKYERVLGLPFDVACFLNIGRDHISANEHPDFEDYFSSKLKIFDQCSTALVNLNSAEAQRIYQAAQAAEFPLAYCIKDKHKTSYATTTDETLACTFHPKADLWATDVTSVDGRVRFKAVWNPIVFDTSVDANIRKAALDPTHRTPMNNLSSTTFELGIPGLFNVENALAAIGMALLLGIDTNAIAEGLAHLRVPGRMEIVRSADEHVTAIIDYAHNKLSFETLFGSIKKEYPHHRIIALFGAPGEKAYERREQLPQAAAPYSDLIIYTEEDPGHDCIEDICADLARNTPDTTPYKIIYDREEAVTFALEAARASDTPCVVLLLAKGDETRQHRGNEYPLVKSDLAIAQEILGA